MNSEQKKEEQFDQAVQDANVGENLNPEKPAFPDEKHELQFD